MAKHNETGAIGEQRAADWLQSRGYVIHFRNWRSGRREVDLIASYDNQWVFVEVKARHTASFGFPEDFVDARKKAFLREAAAAFLWDHPEFPTLRYDVVSILFHDDTVLDFRHFEDAFY